DYIKLLKSSDIAFSLMDTPHPTLVPLEMAAAGMQVVTTECENKTFEKLQGISSNIYAAPPTIAGIGEMLLRVSNFVTDYPARIKGSHINWCFDWQETFDGQFMDKINRFIEEERQYRD
ncbi:MAG: hypothetical protein V1701_06450, partial [Planctomycetota bacterium]